GIGRLGAIEGARDSLVYRYDERGNLVEQVRSIRLDQQALLDRVTYRYDAANQLLEIGYPSGLAIGYPRNAGGQVASVTLAVGDKAPSPLVGQIAYLPFGPLQRLTWGNGITLSREYDQDYQLLRQKVGPWQSDYQHDANGNIQQHRHSLWGTLDYQYDPLDRLTEESGVQGGRSYAYDAVGNRTQRSDNPASGGTASSQDYQYAPDSNRLTAIGAQAVTSDAAGNLTQDRPARKLAYDAQGRLQSVSLDGQQVAEYRYNALGQRIVKLTPESITTYLYGPDGQLLGEAEHDGSGRKLRAQYYLWLDSLPLATIDADYDAQGKVGNPTLLYLHGDHLDTPRLATDASGQIAWQWQSDAFGRGEALSQGSTQVNLRFSGQYYDAESGLHYNYFRDYDPQTGRYVESDPIGLRGGLNTYGYVMGNPLRYIDPTGESIAIVEALVVGAVIVGGAMIINSLGNPAGQDSQGGDNYGVIPDWHNPDYTGPIAPEAPSEMAKGGKQNIDNEYVRDVLAQGKNCNPCEYLRNLYQNERNAVERQKIKQAMKRFNCDGKNRFQ
ncbi:TPA: RHS repeat protein, partial [Pseudomonas aeruginosa]|nr:RHS repeat protein [Pseudomonas aeruginosa]HCF6212327.1 RHS repeat protein [Pseudomonas aeruginosa]HCI3598671.1 RHS repeat protein [Pseudomonas aeruginosa]HCJ0494757.1 RHS repeat protein [Pseudomonas aeruginosa]HCJ0664308.1 RHS repeat protein [Pseudomonas aeruginosa]